MTKGIFILIFGVICANYGIIGITIKDRKKCCDLGTNFAIFGNDCRNFRPEWTGHRLRNEKACLNTVHLCCTVFKQEQIREKDCQLGTTDAVNGVPCSTIDDVRKDCCEACQAGIDTSRAKEPCAGLGLGALYDNAFNQCCEEYSKVTSSTASTLSTSTTTTAKSFIDNSDTDSKSTENICASEVCTQICKPVFNTSVSFKCDCFKGFILMEDGVSCEPEERVLKKEERCELFNPCDHDCIDTGTAIKCSCREGYQLSKNNRTCEDIDECALNIHNCQSVGDCINEVGTYSCYDSILNNKSKEYEYEDDCASGYQYNFEKQLCDDIDECQIKLICLPPKVCKNTIGSYTCGLEEDTSLCPPGFNYNSSIKACADIDECLTGENGCNTESQFCLNTKGNYTCVDKASTNSTCPLGFKMNTVIQLCEDINECEEKENVCAHNEKCVNVPGSHTCVPQENSGSTSTSKVVPTTRLTVTTSTVQPTSTTQKVICPTGYSYVQETHVCADIDECQIKLICLPPKVCKNTIGSYTCKVEEDKPLCPPGFHYRAAIKACADTDECITGENDCNQESQFCLNTKGNYTCVDKAPTCPPGFKINTVIKLCEDINECEEEENVCAHNENCVNVPGSHKCVPQESSSSTSTTQPTSTTQKVICPTGYSYVKETQKCADIDECKSNPCRRFEKCINYKGRYVCIPPIQCKLGYELNESGDQCIDVNECARGIHKCLSTQICKNYVGYYTCECPPGHHVSKITNQCEDIDECKMYSPCQASSTTCINLNGSFRCDCKEGFQRKSPNECVDINECVRDPGICEHNCINILGLYRCSCNKGFTLNRDNRTCTDIDECERFKDRKPCIGFCKNVPGSYRCECPPGYKLGSDGRNCIDIDECQQNVCRSEEICLNTRGGYKCYSFKCPANYIKDTEHKSRCKRIQSFCDPRDYECLLMPEQYTYQYITLVSNLSLTHGNISLFRIKGPEWYSSRAEFTLKLLDVICPNNIERVNDMYFNKVHDKFNSMTLVLVKPIAGPQEIKLQIQMRLFQINTILGNVVVYINIVVSEFPF
ncbi:uncharacterized protein [Diabrotica undecimpunctata]|uniref:uncharacterized protein isoform X2 n=1 Tax=Diabrotica undecimpunctata TaxID=50387 RepID=UPI003B641B48